MLEPRLQRRELPGESRIARKVAALGGIACDVEQRVDKGSALAVRRRVVVALVVVALALGIKRLAAALKEPSHELQVADAQRAAKVVDELRRDVEVVQ